MQETQIGSLVQEDFPHATEQLSPCTTAIEPVLQSRRAATTESTCCSYGNLHTLKPMLCNKRSHHNEKPVHHNQRVAPALNNQRKAFAATKTQQSQKNEINLKKNFFKSLSLVFRAGSAFLGCTMVELTTSFTAKVIQAQPRILFQRRDFKTFQNGNYSLKSKAYFNLFQICRDKLLSTLFMKSHKNMKK